MTFPIFNDGLILFADGAPAMSDNCCCGYYRASYGPCCPTTGVGCRWPAAPISGLTFSWSTWNRYPSSPLVSEETIEGLVSQSGVSYTDQADRPDNCPLNMYIPVTGEVRTHGTDRFGQPYDNTVEIDNYAIFKPNNSQPRYQDGEFIYYTPSGYPYNLPVSPGGDCFGDRSYTGSSSSSTQSESVSLDFYMDARNC
ncbi:hypothetical protein Enr13x_42280 [Stieleria neptunia]|uniref:Uncharacterized protein n=2 Tax=Stieleria neptunia TaxID=2527979 RepID=A0A518HU92_9BACT|nr:hypothetical protein Enr13x_42280 [Stieleria neptunia]